MDDMQLGRLVQKVEDLARTTTAALTAINEAIAGLVRQDVCRQTHIGSDAADREMERRVAALEAQQAARSAAATAGRWGVVAAVVTAVGALVVALLK